MFKNITENLAVGSITDVETLIEIQEKGYKTLIDLCPLAEGNKLDEATMKNLGFDYVSIPVSMQTLNQQTLNSFTTAVKESSQPIYTRCASGLRASVFTLITLAMQEHWTEEKYQTEFNTLGLQHKPHCPLADFAHTCLTE
jgi:uncharacterized protein (TIGR01244 family)